MCVVHGVVHVVCCTCCVRAVCCSCCVVHVVYMPCVVHVVCFACCVCPLYWRLAVLSPGYSGLSLGYYGLLYSYMDYCVVLCNVTDFH